MTETPTKIWIIELKEIGKGSLKAIADVAIGSSLKVYGFRVIQQEGQKAWISPPQRTWQGDDGKPKYAPIVELSGSLKERVDTVILEAFVGKDQ